MQEEWTKLHHIDSLEIEGNIKTFYIYICVYIYPDICMISMHKK